MRNIETCYRKFLYTSLSQKLPEPFRQKHAWFSFKIFCHTANVTIFSVNLVHKFTHFFHAWFKRTIASSLKIVIMCGENIRIHKIWCKDIVKIIFGRQTYLLPHPSSYLSDNIVELGKVLIKLTTKMGNCSGSKLSKAKE